MIRRPLASLASLGLASLVTLLASTVLGCAADTSEEQADDLESAVTVGQDTAFTKVDAPSAQVRVANLTLTIDDAVSVRRDGNGMTATVKLRASRDLANVFSFVPDDAFGTARLTSARTFEIDLAGGYELNTILSGLPLFVSVDTKTGATKHYEARIDLASRFFDFRGSSSIFVDAPIRPVLVREGDQNLRYRGTARADGATSFNISTDDDAEPTIGALGGGKFQFDWGYTLFEIVVDSPEADVFFNANLPGNRLVSKRAHAKIEVGSVGLTRLAAYDVWPSLTCAPRVKACVTAAGSRPDLGHCGTYREVSPCLVAN